MGLTGTRRSSGAASVLGEDSLQRNGRPRLGSKQESESLREQASQALAVAPGVKSAGAMSISGTSSSLPSMTSGGAAPDRSPSPASPALAPLKPPSASPTLNP